jgi:hypothetical protein
MISTYQNYLFLTRNPARTFARFDSDPFQSRAEKYYRENIGKIKTVDAFIKDTRLFSYAMNAFGLQDMQYAKALMKKVLTSDLADSKSVANKFTDTRYRKFAAAFQFDTSGNVKNTSLLQSQNQFNDTISRYQAATKGDVMSPIGTYYLSQTLSKITSVDQLLSNARALKDVLLAYDVSSDTPLTTLKSALTSDISDPSSFVNRQGQTSLKELAADFNFDSTGSVSTERIAQTRDAFTVMSNLYTQKVKFDRNLAAGADIETAYVSKVVLAARSVDSIAKDLRAVKYIGIAFGDANVDSTTIRAILTSDLTDPKSKANVMGPQYRKIAAFFQFTTTGSIARDPNATAQTRTGIENTVLTYVQNAIESQAGRDGSGAQLALYFARQAPTISSPYEVLADKALWKFVQTTLRLPLSVGDNIDRVAETIKSGINFADLRDPTKVNALVARFCAMYDLQNSAQLQNPILQLFQEG